ncbi:MAG: hypothetical protein QXQ87_07215, partial [Halobacteria archaeon]
DPKAFFNNTTNSTFTVDKDPVGFVINAGDDSSALRNSNTSTFRVRIVDQLKYTYLDPATSGLLFPTPTLHVTTNYSANNDSFTASNTQEGGGGSASGWWNKTWKPECSRAAGVQKWKLEMAATGTTLAGNSSDFTVNVWGALALNISNPNTSVVAVKNVDPVTLRVNVSDLYCSGAPDLDGVSAGVTGAVASMNVTLGADSRACDGSLIYDGLGIYNCTVSAATLNLLNGVSGYGLTNITVTANRSWYVNNTTNTTTVEPDNRFMLAARPNVDYGHGGVGTRGTQQGGTVGNNNELVWGWPVNFSGVVSDPDSNDVNLTLYIRLQGASQWTSMGNRTCVAAQQAGGQCDLTALFWERTFTKDEVAVWEYKINGTDAVGLTCEANPAPFPACGETIQTLTIRPHTTQMKESSVAWNSSVNRSGTETDKFIAQAIDVTNTTRTGTEEAVHSGARVEVWVTRNLSNLSSWDTYVTATNATGWVEFDFDPNETYNTGIHVWRAGVAGDGNFTTDFIDTNRSFTVFGQLRVINLTPPAATVVPIGENVTIQFNVSTDAAGEGLLSNTTAVRIELRDPVTSNYESCTTPVNNSSNGSYNCTWATWAHNSGLWDLRIGVEKDPSCANASGCYRTNNTTFAARINLTGTAPEWQSPAVNRTAGAWGDAYNFSIQVRDLQGEAVTCRLQTWTNNTTGWVGRGNTTLGAVADPGQAAVFRTCAVNVSAALGNGFNGSDFLFNQSNPVLFRFNMTAGPDANISGNVTAPAFTKDTASVSHVAGNGSSVARGSPVSLSLRATDLNRSLDVEAGRNGTLWVTRNNTTFGPPLNTTTALGGFVNASFTPDCSYVPGVRTWRGGLWQDSHYFDNNSTNLTLTILGRLSNNITSPNATSGAEFLRRDANWSGEGTNVTLYGNVTDDCGALVPGASVTFYLESQATGTNYTCPATDLGDGNYSCDFDTLGKPAKGYNVTMASNKTFHSNATLRKDYPADRPVPAGNFDGLFLQTKLVFWNVSLRTGSVDNGDAGRNGSWEERFYWSANVSDEDGDQNTVRVWHMCASGTCATNGVPLVMTLLGSVTCAAPCEGNYTEFSTVWYSANGNNPDDNNGTWNSKMNATDDANDPRSGGTSFTANDTAVIEYVVEESDMWPQHVAGDAGLVFRNGSDSIALSTRVFDLDIQPSGGYAGSGVPGRLYITKDGFNYTSPFANMSTTATGYWNQSVNPDCTYRPGIQQWRMGVIPAAAGEPDGFKHPNNSSTFTLQVNGTIENATVTYPAGQNISKGAVLTVNFTVRDDCGGLNNTTRQLQGCRVGTACVAAADSFTIDNSSITDLGDGNYTATVGTGTKNLGDWNISLTVSAPFYTLNTTTVNGTFRLVTSPEVQYATLDLDDSALAGDSTNKSGNAAGWGERWRFVVECRDQDNDVFTVYLWRQNNSTAPWVLLGNQSCQGASGGSNFVRRAFNITFDPYNTTRQGEVGYFKFNATDPGNFTGETVPNKTMTIQKDDVRVDQDPAQGDGVQIDRFNWSSANNSTLSVRVRDRDRFGNPAVDAVTPTVRGGIWITQNTTDLETASNYTFNASLVANASSYLAHAFNPGCSFRVGLQRWTAGTFGDSAYFDTNRSTVGGVSAVEKNYTLTVNGTLLVNLTSPGNGTVFNVGSQNPLLRFSQTTDCWTEDGQPVVSVKNIQLQRNETGNREGVVETCAPQNNETPFGNTGVFNCTFNTVACTLPAGPCAGGRYDIIVTVNNTNLSGFFYNNTTRYAQWMTFVNPPPNNTTANNTQAVNRTSGPWGGAYNFSVEVNDTAQDNVTCTLWFSNGTGVNVSKGNRTITGGLGTCSIIVDPRLGNGFNGGDIGTDNGFWFTLDDGTPENRVNTTTRPFPDLTADNVTLVVVAGNGSSVSRMGVNNTTLQASVFDNDTGNYTGNVSVRFNVTLNGNSWDNGNVVASNATGVASFAFDPNGPDPSGPPGYNYFAGVQNWMAEVADSRYNYTNTTGGGSNATLAIVGSFLVTPEPAVPANETEILRGSNLTLGVEVREDNLTFMTTANVSFTTVNITNSAENCPITSATGGIYECAFVSAGKGARSYNYTAAVNRTYFANTTFHHNGSVDQGAGTCTAPSGLCYAFFVGTKPTFANPLVKNQSSAFLQNINRTGWGENYTFQVQYTDEDRDPAYIVTLTLQKGLSVTNVSQSFLNDPDPTNKTLTFNINFSNGGDIGNWTYEFNAQDDENYPKSGGAIFTNNSTRQNISLEADDVTVIYFCNSATNSSGGCPSLDHKQSFRDDGADSPGVRAIDQNLTAAIYDTDDGNFTGD